MPVLLIIIYVRTRNCIDFDFNSNMLQYIILEPCLMGLNSIPAVIGELRSSLLSVKVRILVLTICSYLSSSSES